MILLTVAYDGSGFYGFQKQREEPTVQSVLHQALEKVNGRPTKALGAGRTDSGVHAFAQAVCFRPSVSIPVDRWPLALNRELPDGIWVKGAREVDDDFDPIERAHWKHYRYRIRRDDSGLPFLANYAWHLFDDLDTRAMKRAGSELRGERDFAAFQVTGRPVTSTVRNMYELRITEDHHGYCVDLIANGFLYKMARTIVGTLVEIGKGGMTLEEMCDARDRGDRSSMGPTAPAHGLFLVRVGYDGLD
ncbi:MAG: tRNA pseudouridine(38-40) synthase TruA [Clostridia bacterium]